MKLRNKKTGEVGELTYQPDKEYHFAVCPEDPSDISIYKTLAELNKEWEDYKEPKDNDYWYIDDLGRIQFSSGVLDEVAGHPNNWMARKLFGNYFETREEAEKAVEKLKAWKRLKDKGFKFDGYHIYAGEIHFDIVITKDLIDEFDNDMEICFGGEEL